MAGESAVILLRDSCASKTIRVASRTTPGDPSRAMRADPIDRFEYPIRDVFRVDERRIWLLTNQEGSGLSEETAARHVLLVTDGNLERTVPLQRKGRLLLAADSHQLTVLYADGGIETIPVP